ncbi:MAG: T9SS type A sorting domain-containing protein [Chitinophagaceae bacterium]
MKAIYVKVPYIKNLRKAIVAVVGFWVFILFTGTSVFAQPTFVGVSSNPSDAGSVVTSTVTIAPPSGTQVGDLIVIFAHYRATGATLTVSTTGGQTWTSETANSGGTQTARVFWCRFNGTWAASPIISGGNGTNPLSAIMYAYRPTSSTSLWAIHVAQTTSSTTNTAISITGLTTTLPNTVTMAFWASPAATTWGAVSGSGWVKPTFPVSATQVTNTGGSDQSHTGAYNIRASAGAVANTSQTQSSSQNTRTSIICWNEINDECAGAVSLTSSTTCSNTTGTLTGATYSTLTGACGTASRNDVWYSFVAQTTNPTITLSSAPTQASIQLFSGSCGSLSAEQCSLSSTTLTASGLTIGNTYYVRIFSNNNTTGTFSICVTDPYPIPANDDCSNAVGLTSASSCGTPTNGTLFGATNSALAACSGTSNDVWYTFTAQTTNPTITLGSTLGTNGRFQILSGTCGGTLNSEFCSTSNSQAASGLTIGTTYFVRVYSATTANVFNICIVDPAPTNNAFGSPTTLTPGISCSSTAGTLYLGTYVAATPTVSGSCVSGTISSDVWYSFVAPGDIATITLSGAGSDVTGVEVLTTISGTNYSIACGGPTGIPVVNVVAGNTYYVRVYKTGTAPSAGVNSAFSICVTVPSVPNDDCSGAINLSVSANCSKAMGTMSMATLSSGFGTVGTCGSAASATQDVWYKFTATTANPTITITDYGSAFPFTKGIEIYQGTCGVLLPMSQCANASSGTSLGLNASGLIVGTTYYVRVYTTGTPVVGNGKFSICVTSGATSNVRTGNSYVNVTKNTTGGVVEVGDILEIRMTIWVGYGATLYNARYLDNIPTKTTMQTGNEIQIITNEGLRYRGYTATDNVNDDAATYKSAPPAGEYNIRANLGTTGTLPLKPANNTATDLTGDSTLVSTSSAVPRAGSGLMFAVAYRVQVSGVVGDTIQLNGGMFRYRTATSSTADSIVTGTPYKIIISQPLTLCSNSFGVNNASEYGGTFGSGNTLNRSTDLSNPIAGYTFVSATSAQSVGDGQYALVNNTSPRGGTNQSANKKNVCPTNVAPDLLCDNRMFTGYWYINGDHTGTGNAAGNAPAAPGTTGGYMLAVNADYVASEAYRQQLSGLCPNTYYEFSAWFKNICPSCGADSTGAQFAGTPTAPTAGYVGVYPNLSFALDGLDRYSTGQIDVVSESSGWVKKGFVFKTDSSQTSATLSIRNNAQGGGGNDWVMDDISIATCFPSMSYSPTATPMVCSGNTIQVGDTVRSQFSNYTYYVWQRSQDGGVTWADLTTAQTASPTLVSGQYQYITTLNVPSANTTLADSGDIYRVYTGTTLTNITNPNCVANDGSAPISLSVLNCGVVLKTDLLSFNGNLMNKYAVLSWSTSKEDAPVHFELQRSDDNSLFNTIAIINGKNNGQDKNYYSYTDPQQLDSKKWYRVLMILDNNNMKYSSIIQLNMAAVDFDIENVVNPFSSQLSFNVLTNKSAKADVELIDMQGQTVKSTSFLVYSGNNSLRIPNTDVLAPGVYTLRIRCNDKAVSKKVVKNNN